MAKTHITLGGHTLEIDDDVTSYTAAELGMVERYTGMTLSEFGRKLADTENLSILAWSAIAWIGLRRAGGTTPWDVFVDDLKVTDLLAGLTATDGDVLPERVVPNRADRRRAAARGAATEPPVRQEA